MGGRGSGRTQSFATDKCEDYRSIDLAWLRRQNSRSSGREGRLTWSRNDAVFASVSYSLEDTNLRLIYRTRSYGGNWKDVAETLPITTTKTNFGGQRHWFICPSCRHRCRKIYGGSYFRCRRCHGLKYESQYERNFNRAATQAHKLRSRLGQSGSLDDSFPEKPKGMHWRTYHRLQQRDTELQNAWAAGCWKWLR